MKQKKVIQDSCTFAMCVQEHAPSENILKDVIWHVWSTFAKIFTERILKNFDHDYGS